jgi:mono/diheme cytochrome c family protein
MMGGSAENPTPSPGKSTRGSDDAVQSGAALFAQQCATCHGQNGQGVSGTFPPLAGSEWVTGDISVLARIVLHGLEGSVKVNGQRYDGVMPAFGNRLSDSEMAEVLTFLRTSLNEKDESVTAEEIARVRDNYADRRQAWSPQELRADEESPE